MGNIINKVDMSVNLKLNNIKKNNLADNSSKKNIKSIEKYDVLSQTPSIDNYTPEYAEMMMLSGDSNQVGFASQAVSQGSIDISGLATVGSTVVTTLGGAINGVGNVVEDLVDFATILETAKNSTHTALIDGISYLLTGESLGLTEQLWDNTMAFVQEGYVDNFFEWFFTDTDAGKLLNDNAIEAMQYGNDGYNISKTVGYIGGEIALTVATAGIGTGATAGASTASNLARTGAMVGFSAGTGRGASESWNSGASLEEGLTYGLASGAWEGAQWAVGGATAGAGLRAVVADVTSGALEVPVRSALEGIYSDEDYATRFENNGGVQGIITNMALAGILSGAGEWASLKVNNDETVMWSADINPTNIREMGRRTYAQVFRGLDNIGLRPKDALYSTESSISFDDLAPREAIINSIGRTINSDEQVARVSSKLSASGQKEVLERQIKLLREDLETETQKKTILLEQKEEAKKMFDQAQNYEQEVRVLRLIENINSLIADSEKTTVSIEKTIDTYNSKIDILNKMQEPNYIAGANDTLESLFSSIDTDNKAGMDFMKKIYSLSSEGNDLCVVLSSKETSTYYSSINNAVVLQPKSNDIQTLAHELGHALHYIVLDHKIPDNFSDVVQKAREISSKDDKVLQATENVETEINKLFRERKQREIEYNVEMLIKQGLEPEEANKIALLNINNNLFQEVAEQARFNNSHALMDIIDAVYAGNHTDLNGNPFVTIYGHGKEYYSSTQNQFDEMIANFTDLKVNNRQEELNTLRTLFGDDFYNMLDETFQNMVKL